MSRARETFREKPWWVKKTKPKPGKSPSGNSTLGILLKSRYGACKKMLSAPSLSPSFGTFFPFSGPKRLVFARLRGKGGGRACQSREGPPLKKYRRGRIVVQRNGTRRLTWKKKKKLSARKNDLLANRGCALQRKRFLPSGHFQHHLWRKPRWPESTERRGSRIGK